jgi:hypothetical protein
MEQGGRGLRRARARRASRPWGEADALGGRAGSVRDEQGAVVSRLSEHAAGGQDEVVSRLGEGWLYYELCSLIIFSFFSLCFLID